MTMKTVGRFLIASLVTIAVSSILGAGLSLAGKPTGGGGGGGGSTSGGTIYFSSGGGYTGMPYGLNSMNSDGSGKKPLPLSGWGSSSRLLHVGHRWFVDTRAIEGETDPNGYQRYEKFAVRDDGNETVTIQLTDDPGFHSLGVWDWAPGETTDTGLLSGFGSRSVFNGVDWVVDPNSVGIYTAIVLFDGAGNVLGLEAPPEFLTSVGVVNGTLPDAYNRSFDWSPDLTEIVYANYDRTALLIQNVLTGATRAIPTDDYAYDPKWSPAGNLIVYGTGYGSIATIAPDGSGRKEIIRWGVSYGYYYPEFSRTGSHILYNRIPHGQIESDLFRATPSGSNKVNLTPGIPGIETSFGWR